VRSFEGQLDASVIDPRRKHAKLRAQHSGIGQRAPTRVIVTASTLHGLRDDEIKIGRELRKTNGTRAVRMTMTRTPSSLRRDLAMAHVCGRTCDELCVLGKDGAERDEKRERDERDLHPHEGALATAMHGNLILAGTAHAGLQVK
jgi:hypothetical protein